MRIRVVCKSVFTGWQSLNIETGEVFGPVFHLISDLWDWQKENQKEMV